MCIRDSHFDTEELDDGDDKDQRHSFNLKKSKFTNLFLDAEHSGAVSYTHLDDHQEF